MCIFASAGYSYQSSFYKKKNLWEQNHIQPDGRGGYYNHKPGTGIWEDEHVTPDGHGGYYIHKPGTGLWEDEHVISDGHGGVYY
ncbi:MAG: hypothetical protein K1000chlam3_01363 [Chlamydiae bacterium]|nr:hypothetical protein [Chlamydiota bacterium]